MVAGVDRTTSIAASAGVEIQRPYNERATASFTLLPGTTADLLDSVYLYAKDGITPIFGGLIYGRQTQGSGQLTELQIECVDWSVYADWRYLSTTYASSWEPEPPPKITLKTVLQDIVASMSSLGVTLDAGQVDGPDLEAFDWELVRCSDALRELSDKTGYMVTWSPTKVLSMALPGTVSAPASITDNAANAQALEWSESLDGYATKVYVLCGPDGAGETWQEWAGDGSTHSWTTDIRATTPDPTCVQVYSSTMAAFKTVTTKTVFHVASSSANSTATITSSTPSNGEAEVTCSTDHNLQAGDSVIISDHSGSTPSLNGTHTVTMLVSTKKFTVGVALSVGGTGGTAQRRVTTITTTKDHNFAINDTVKIADHSVSAVNGTKTVIEVTGATTFTVQATVASGGNSGTVVESKADFLWNRSTHTLSVDQGTIPTAGQTVRLDFTGRFPFTVSADSGASPQVIYRCSAPDIVTKPAGQDLANGLLVQMYQRPIEVSVETLVDGWAPGQLLTATSTYRGLDLDGLITDVAVRLESDTFWRYAVKATGIDASTPAKYRGGPLSYFRQIGGGSSAATIGGVSGGSGTTVITNKPSPSGLGGSRVSSVPMAASPTYTPVIDWIPYTAPASASYVVRVALWARAGGVSATARLYDITAASVVATSSPITSTTSVETTFTAALTAEHTYRLEIVSDTANESVYGIGVMEAL